MLWRSLARRASPAIWSICVGSHRRSTAYSLLVVPDSSAAMGHRLDEYCENQQQPHQQQPAHQRTMMTAAAAATTTITPPTAARGVVSDVKDQHGGNGDNEDHCNNNYNRMIVNENPATGEIIDRIPCTTNVDELVQRAVVAHKETTWGTPTVTVSERIQLLRDGLVVLEQQGEIVARMIVQEMGKPWLEAQAEVASAVDKKETYLDLLYESLQPVRHGTGNVVVRSALGVVVIASPWNYPCEEILLLTLPALASGNTVIVKPSEYTPLTGALTVQALASVLPPNVLQLAQGDGQVGAALVQHPAVSMIAMTGSSATGQHILQTAAPQMKRLVLELGAKTRWLSSPMLMYPARQPMLYSIRLANAGQVCCSIERIYVADAIYDDFITRVVVHAQSYPVGNGLDLTTKVGPLVSARQRQKVTDQVNDALWHGARLVYQSNVPVGTGGYYYPVTVLADVTPVMKLYREETFGPVITIIRFSGTEQDAIELANDTEYGLAASVYTQDLAMATRLSHGIQAGQVGINCYAPLHMESTVPWVGHKASGYGYHSGREGFHNFSLPKTIVFANAAPIDV